MRKGLFTITAICCLAVGAFIHAEPNSVIERDVRYIKDWMRDQHARDLAATLNLEADQVERLRLIKQKVASAKTEIQADRDAFQAQTAAEAARIRANLEAANQLSDQDRDALQDLRRKRRELARTSRLKLQLAAVGLRDILESHQRDQVRQFAQRNRPKTHEDNAERGPRQRGVREGRRLGRRHMERRGTMEQRGDRDANAHPRIARILLSDAFLAYYSSPN